MNLVASSICFLNALTFFFVSASNLAAPLFSRKRIASDVRYMSLRTLVTASGRHLCRLPCSLICSPMLPVTAPSAGTVSGLNCLVRTYSDSALRGSAGAATGLALRRATACVTCAIATNCVICSAGIARFSA